MSLPGDCLARELAVITIPPAQQREANSWFDKGSRLENRGEYDAAIAAYTRAVELDPLYVQASFGRGLAQSMKGNHDLAIRDSRRP